MPGQRGIVRVYFEALVVSLMVATFARTFLAQGLHISSASMEETLLVGDHVLVNRFLFWDQRPTLRRVSAANPRRS